MACEELLNRDVEQLMNDLHSYNLIDIMCRNKQEYKWGFVLDTEHQIDGFGLSISAVDLETNDINVLDDRSMYYVFGNYRMGSYHYYPLANGWLEWIRYEGVGYDGMSYEDIEEMKINYKFMLHIKLILKSDVKIKKKIIIEDFSKNYKYIDEDVMIKVLYLD